MHPTRAATLAAACDPDAALAELREVAEEGVRAGKCVAVGEAGVDFARLAFCDAPTQAAAGQSGRAASYAGEGAQTSV